MAGHRLQYRGSGILQAVCPPGRNGSVLPFAELNLELICAFCRTVGAHERLESNDAKWLNMIMDRPAIAAFVAGADSGTAS
jgi:hypothetical protein